MPEREPPATILAFDYGNRRIGVAVGQSVTGSASPLGVVANGSGGPDHAAIAALLAEWQPGRLVVGLPLGANGKSTPMSRAVEDFIEELGRYGLPVTTIDERHTSREARATLKQARQRGSRGRIRRAHIDAAAAVRIAERYLDADA